MRKRLLTVNMMLSALLLTATVPIVKASAASSVSSETNSSLKSEANSSAGNDKQTQTVKTLTTNDKIQTLTSQTMILKKIVIKGNAVTNGVGSLRISQDKFKGINGSTYKVYDVTELLNTILKEKLKTDSKITATGSQIDKTVDENQQLSSSSQLQSGESSNSSASNSKEADASAIISSSEQSSSETVDKTLETKVEALLKNDTLREEVASRAGKLGSKQLKLFATVKTGHDAKLNSDGIASVKLPVDGKYHAYYVVNTATPKASYVTNADPVVVFTPITEDNGLYASDFSIYTKSSNIPQPKVTVPKKITTVKMYQTGIYHPKNLLDKLVNTVSNLLE